MNNGFDNISPTAVDVAISRALYTGIPYAVEIARELGSCKELIPLSLRKAIYRFYPSVLQRKSILEIRYASTNDALSSLEEPTVLEIAAGLSPRGLKLSNEGTLYVETDLESMIEQKKVLVKKVREAEGKDIDRNYHFLPLNICNRNDFIRAGELISSNDGDDPVAVIHEGLFEYLSLEQQEIARENIAFFLETYSNDGAWITPDLSFHTKENSFSEDAYHFARKLIKGINPPTYFSNDNEVQKFLGEGGLKGNRRSNEHLIKNLTCLKKGLSPEVASELASHYEAYVIRLD